MKKLDYDTLLELSRKVVSRHAKYNTYCKNNLEDVIMSVVEKFLIKEKHILESFKATASLKTYYYAVLNRMCLEVLRSEMGKQDIIVESEVLDVISEREVSFEAKIFIEEEVSRLKTIMVMFDDEMAKTNLFLKYYYRLLIKIFDLKRYAKSKYKSILFLRNSNKEMKKAEIFNDLALAVKSVEDKGIKGDAVRIWLNKQMDIIISRLNKNRESKYDKDSLSILFDYAND
ncbi:MAG: hypothetical protein N4A72_05975 [Bacteroidales bacterium]|jgi:hypothetical protein|nr:hypothetical protein [Bacteroidales bacterium]